MNRLPQERMPFQFNFLCNLSNFCRMDCTDPLLFCLQSGVTVYTAQPSTNVRGNFFYRGDVIERI